MPKTKQTTQVMPTAAAAGLIPAGLGSDFETVQIIPATGYWAKYKDGSRYPVVAWAMQSRLLKDDERRDFDDAEIPPAFISRVIGLVLFAKESTLIEADNYLIAGDDDFAGYEYDL